MRRTLARAVSIKFVALVLFVFAYAHGAEAEPGIVTIYTSPIEITGERIAIQAVAPDRDTGGMVDFPLPPGVLGPGMTALTAVPINVLFDTQWNGSPAQQAAGTSPRQLACDGPNGVRAQVMRQAAPEAAYNVSCNFPTAGTVHVVKLEGGLYLSYQLYNNLVTFSSTSPYTCNPENGSPFCPNDPRFTLRFAVEMLSLIWTPSLCAMRADPPAVYLHAVQFDSENAASSAALFFKGGRFLAGELAMQAREATAAVSVDTAFQELRTACAGGGPVAQVMRAFTELETEVDLPGGVTFTAIHPPIAAPKFQNVSLPYGDNTCKSGFVWREAAAGDLVCVTPEVRAQSAEDNALASTRRSPTGGPYGEATCLPGYVWREALPNDLVCVTPETRAQTAADNAAGPSRRVLQPSEFPSFTRPSISAPPIVEAGAEFQVNGQFFPHAVDPTKLQLSVERSSTSACNGGASELESGRLGDTPQTIRIPAGLGSWSSCTYRHEVTGLQPSTQYRFRIRDCDAITCSLWSEPFETMTPAQNAGPTPVTITLDTGAVLGAVAPDAGGAFLVPVVMPNGTPAGGHSITAASGTATDTIGIQVTAPGGAAASLMVTGSFFGDQGCPMRETYNKIPAAQIFSLFGSGFGPELVTVRLDTPEGPMLGWKLPESNGTFCGYFNGPAYDYAGNHVLVAMQGGASRANLPVEVLISHGPR